MRKLITFNVVALLFMSTAIWAAAPTHLHVHQKSGDIYSAAIKDVSLLTFASSNLLVHDAQPAQEFPLKGVRKITFGDAQNSAVENLQANAMCQAFVNDGMLIVRATEGINSLQVVNLAGQVVFAGQYANNQHLEINAHTWAQGMYIVLMQTTNGSANTKIMLH